MNGQLIPDEYSSVPGWRNAFESTAAVQLHHRALALSTLAAVGTAWWGARPAALPPPSRLLLHGMLGMAGLQVALGLTTLLTCVQPAIASAHQAGALTLFTVTLGLLHTLRAAPGPPGLVATWGTPAALLAIAAVGGMAVTST
jgi:heme a synthase